MRKNQSPIKIVDHVSIRVHDAREFFSFFTDTLQLPVVWSVASYGPTLSGIVSAGNANIEIFQYGSQIENPTRARIYAIAFKPHDLSTCLSQLAARNIPHSPPIPSWGTRPNGYHGKLWTNILIGGLIGGKSFTYNINRLLKGNIYLSNTIGALIGRISACNWAQPFIRKALGEHIILITEYAHDICQTISNARSEDSLQDNHPLGIISIKEVIVGVRNFEEKLRRWQDLLSPTIPIAPGIWQLNRSPAIRLVTDSTDSIRAIILRVSSLDLARHFLESENYLGEVLDGYITIDAKKLKGLDIRFTE